MKVLYYFSYSFADAMSAEICSRVAGKDLEGHNIFSDRVQKSAPSLPRKVLRRVKRRLKKTASPMSDRPAGLLSLGSIFQFAQSGDHVWGTGVNPIFQKTKPFDPQPTIHAVRGPLSRRYLQDELKYDCPEVYGDPGILFADFFPEFQREDQGQPLLLAQHFDEEYITKNPSQFEGHDIFMGQRDMVHWKEFVQKISKASFVVSSSLHGLILAESLGVPARWWYNDTLPNSTKSGRFKYNDYYLSTGREENINAESIEEALSDGAPPLPDLSGIKKNLLEAFPNQLFSSHDGEAQS